MAQAEVDIWNLALSYSGVDAAIVDPNEASRAAELCRLHYPGVRDGVLKAAMWGCARSARRLALIATADTGQDWAPGDPEPGWTYTYQLPNDYLHPRYTAGYGQFIVGAQDNKNILFSNEPNLILIYTLRQVNVGLWPQELVDAVSYGLASAICLPQSGKQGLAQFAVQVANNKIMQARTLVGNTNNQQVETMPDWLQARGISGPGTSQFIYPFGPLLTVQNVPGPNV